MVVHGMTPGLVVFVAIIFIVVTLVSGDENEYRLIRDLLAGYDKRVRPSNNHSESLNVTFGLALAQIIDVDMKNQILTTNCWLNQIWTDVGLQWDPEKYGGIQVVRLPYEEVWRPDILLSNNADVSSHFSSISSNVIVEYYGNVTWLSMVIFKSSCPINVRYFPFDWQNCSMWFASWTYDGFKINLLVNSNEGDISNYIPNSEWELAAMLVERNIRYYSCCKEPYPDITYHIIIKRRPLFYIFNMVLPCILITLVALLGFYIPSDSGEKVTMGITTLLSMTVFMMLVTESMPPTSDVLPLIGIYYGMTIFIVSFATGMTVFTLNIHHKGVRGKEVPAFVKMICFRFLAPIFCIRVESSSSGCGETVGYTRGSERVNMGHVDIQLENEHLLYQPNPSSHVAPPSPGKRPPYPPPSASSPSVVAAPAQCQGGTSGNYLAPTPQHVQPPLGHTCACQLPPPPPPTPFAAFSDGNGNSSSGRVGPSLGQQLAGNDHLESQFSRVLHKVYKTIERNEIRVIEQDKRDVIKLEWQQVAQIADRVLLLCFVTATVTITGIVLFQAPSNPTSQI